MTEEEAKTKWCPMVRHPDYSGGSFNRGTNNDPINMSHHDGLYGCQCIASACMMWRVDEVYPERGGYCGLGVKP